MVKNDSFSKWKKDDKKKAKKRAREDIGDIFKIAKSESDYQFAETIFNHTFYGFNISLKDKVSWLRNSLDRYPEHSELYNGLLGWVYFNKKKFDRAVPYLKKSLDSPYIADEDLRGFIPSVRSMLGMFYLSKEDKRCVDVLKCSSEAGIDSSLDVLLGHSFLFVEDFDSAYNLSGESLRKMSELHTPDCDAYAHFFAVYNKSATVLGLDENPLQIVPGENPHGGCSVLSSLFHIFKCNDSKSLFDKTPMFNIKKLFKFRWPKLYENVPDLD